MKKFIYTLFFSILFIQCEDVIEVEVPQGEERLVIDAFLKFMIMKTPKYLKGAFELPNQHLSLKKKFRS